MFLWLTAEEVLASFPSPRPPGRPSEQRQYLVEQADDVCERPAHVEQVRHGAERRAEQPTGRVGIDVEY